MAPKVSVIIPVYNVEKYLRQCLDSVINQTLKDIEIICVDDGSVDNSYSILEEYQKKDKRIILLRQDNNGAGAARNKGLKIARGEYLSFLDSDDFFESDMLEKVYCKATEKEADIVIYRIAKFNDKTKAITSVEWIYKADKNSDVFNYKDIPRRIFNSFQNWTWNKLFRTSFIVDNNIMFQEIKRTNDLLFTCTALVCAQRIVTLDSVLANYRVGMESNCQATNNKSPLDFYHAFLELKEVLLRKGIYSEVEQSFVNWALDGCIYNLNSLKTPESFEKVFSELRNEGFRKLGISEHKNDYFYHKHNYTVYRKIMKMPIDGHSSKNENISFEPQLKLEKYKYLFLNHYSVRSKIDKGIRCLKDNGLRYTILQVFHL